MKKSTMIIYNPGRKCSNFIFISDTYIRRKQDVQGIVMYSAKFSPYWPLTRLCHVSNELGALLAHVS
jgi:hypothetical protein